MSARVRRAWLAILVAAPALSSCAGAASVTAAPSSPAGATETPSIGPAASGSPAQWTVSDTSKATVRVHEQLVNVSLPSDAVLTATGAKGGFSLNADGTFSGDSKISFELTTLASDQRQRDDFVKNDTLAVRQFPTATFVPTKATGLALPLGSGELSFTLAGTMTVHGTSKAVTFDVKATRSGGDLVATATANPPLRFEDFGMRAPAVPFRVVSVTDEIRLVIDLVATGSKS